jgi:orotidine-5'-phosphate decarboxylase
MPTITLDAPASLRDRLIVALDVPNARAAQALVTSIGDAAGFFKVGLQLFTAEGPNLVRELVSSGRKVFLDLKLHDIPNTVGHAVHSAAALGVHMLTVHASGGAEMLRAAVQASNQRLSLLAVTVLTSLNDDDLQQVGVSGRTLDQVLRLASLAQTAGCNGVVASPQEVAQLRKTLGEGFGIVVPGIRPLGSDKNDQQRIATPAETIRAGASHLVVGRPITQAGDPAQAVRDILAELTSGTRKII